MRSPRSRNAAARRPPPGSSTSSTRAPLGRSAPVGPSAPQPSKTSSEPSCNAPRDAFTSSTACRARSSNPLRACRSAKPPRPGAAGRREAEEDDDDAAGGRPAPSPSPSPPPAPPPPSARRAKSRRPSACQSNSPAEASEEARRSSNGQPGPPERTRPRAQAISPTSTEPKVSCQTASAKGATCSALAPSCTKPTNVFAKPCGLNRAFSIAACSASAPTKSCRTSIGATSAEARRPNAHKELATD
mmetsp:Transcript_80152/g.230090  ORF Transcript_80152/g.230090 Transcript_80152/m.230090 type:complete len:245 (+) Transcript_80152:880-1614(+)